MEQKKSPCSANSGEITRFVGAVAHMREAQKRYERNNLNGEFVDVKEWYEKEVDNLLGVFGYPKD